MRTTRIGESLLCVGVWGYWLWGGRKFAGWGCLRRPYLFRLAGKEGEEKGRLDAFGACRSRKIQKVLLH